MASPQAYGSDHDVNMEVDEAQHSPHSPPPLPAADDGLAAGEDSVPPHGTVSSAPTFD